MMCDVGVVRVKASASGAAIRGSIHPLAPFGFFFPESSHASDLKSSTPGAQHSILGSALRLVGPVSESWTWGEIESLICNFYRSVAARTIF